MRRTWLGRQTGAKKVIDLPKNNRENTAIASIENRKPSLTQGEAPLVLYANQRTDQVLVGAHQVCFKSGPVRRDEFWDFDCETAKRDTGRPRLPVLGAGLVRRRYETDVFCRTLLSRDAGNRTANPICRFDAPVDVTGAFWRELLRRGGGATEVSNRKRLGASVAITSVI